MNMGGWRLSRSKWMNPFKITPDSSREKVCEDYEKYIRSKPELMESLKELSGKKLGCWCKPSLCHGDILIKLFREKLISHVPVGNITIQ